jgi:hypothetical protein
VIHNTQVLLRGEMMRFDRTMCDGVVIKTANEVA